jgi:hypothetical protein
VSTVAPGGLASVNATRRKGTTSTP